MKLVRYLVGLAMLLMFLTSCGSAGGDQVGSLTVAATKTDNTNGTFNVAAMATYTHPTKTDLVGIDINFQVFDTLTGEIFHSSTERTPTNGKVGVNATVPQQVNPRAVFVVVSTGDLQDSEVVTIPELGSITPDPSTLTYAITDPVGSQKAVSVTGGTLVYNVSSSNNTLATATVSGGTVTVTRQSAAVGTVVITIADTAGASATVTVILQ